MAYNGYVLWDDTELFNVARTVYLSRAMGLNSVRVSPETVEWYAADQGVAALGDITLAPWYSEGVEASAEFAGFLPLDVTGLSDSSYAGAVVEYVTAGGNTGRGRNTTAPFVANVVLVASSPRGAEYGLRWLKTTLRQGAGCGGVEMAYYSSPRDLLSFVRRREVALTRGVNVTASRDRGCESLRTVTFTLTAGDPFVYEDFGGVMLSMSVTGEISTSAPLVASGVEYLTNSLCPTPDFNPQFDPLFPALIAPPALPNFLPAGWGLEPGMPFRRAWARVGAFPLNSTTSVPVVSLRDLGTWGGSGLRNVRVGFWPYGADVEAQCDPLFSVVITYFPSGADRVLLVDSRGNQSYVESTVTRRSDSLVFSPDAGPVAWTDFLDREGYLLTIDTFETSPGVYAGDVNSTVEFSMIGRSD